MNRVEKEIVTASLENMFAGSERKEKESVEDYALRMETSVKNGCHTIMKLLETHLNNKDVIGKTILWLEKHPMLYEDYEISEIITEMTKHNFTGN